MMHKTQRSALMLAGAVAAGLVTASAADAALLKLTLSSSSAVTTTITDGGAGDSDGLVNGRIQNNQFAYGTFSLIISVATSNSPGGDIGSLTISSITISNGSAAASDLQLLVSDIDYSLPGVAGTLMTLTSSSGGTMLSGGVNGLQALKFTSFADPANGQPAAAFIVGPAIFTSNGTPNQSFSNTLNGAFVRGAGAYSLANYSEVSLPANATIQFNGVTTVVPEPTTLSLLGLGAMVAVRRRRA